MDKLEFCCNCANLKNQGNSYRCEKLNKIKEELSECEEPLFFELDVDSISWFQKLVKNFRYNEKISTKGLLLLEKYVMLLNEMNNKFAEPDSKFLKNQISDLFYQFVVLNNELGFDLKEIMENGLKRNCDVRSKF